MASFHLRSLLSTLLLTSIAGAMQPAWALPISQYPLVIPNPPHPQVLFAITNSESMDGDLNGAIWTGSGALSSTIGLHGSSSPVNYTVPVGFTAPVTGTTSGNSAPFTSVSGSVETDNSASRLNEAKAGIQAIVQAYAPSIQFGLEKFNAATGSVYTTWVYQMSGPSGYSFSTTNTSPPAGFEYVQNPCQGYLSGPATVNGNCAAISSQLGYASATLNTDNFMLVAQSSDDPSVNDVLYDTGSTPVFVDYGAPNPTTPYPPNRTLAQYNTNSITVSYPHVTAGGVTETGPTNAGFVPYSPQVLYAERGFGYFSTASATSGTINVTMQDAGQTPTAASIAAVNAAFVAPLAPETNQSGSAEIKAVAFQSPIAGLMATAKSYLTGLPAGTCNRQQYVILISDGLPTQDLNNLNWPPLGSAAGTAYGVTATFNTPGDGSLISTNDQALKDSISNINALSAAGIKTYVIGLGAGVATANNPQAAASLKAMAVAGGTTNYFPATSSSALVADLNIILNSITNASLNTGSLPVAGVRLGAGSMSYQPSFKAGNAGRDWTGDLVAYSINPTTGAPVASVWGGNLINPLGAQAKIQSLPNNLRDQRNIFIMTQAGTAAGHTATPFNVAALGANTNAQLTFLGLNPATFSSSYGARTPADVVNYLMGDSTYETPAGPFRSRTAVLGDIVNSVPAISLATDDYGFAQTLPVLLGGGATYTAYLNNKKARTPSTVVYVGANDGMLHAFDGTATGGTELFDFIPNSVTGKLGLLIDPDYVHNYYVDGSATVFDACYGNVLPAACAVSNWHTVLVGSTGAGGSGVFALDVTNPASIGPANIQTNAMWEVTSASDPDIGTAIGAPLVILGEDNNWYAAFGNGYNSTNANPVLVLVNLQTGVITTKLTGNDGGTYDNGIGQIAAIDSDGDGKVDTIYGGDYRGNLWKFDLSSTSAASWNVAFGNVPLYKAADSLGNPQPITGGLEIGAGPINGAMLYFGTGSFFLTTDNTLASPPLVESLYAVWDNGTAVTAAPGRSALVQQTISAFTAGTLNSRTTSSNPVSYDTTAATQRGFFMDLINPTLGPDGERFIGTPVLQGGNAFYTTYEPNAGSSCQPGGQNWQYGLDALSGAAALSSLSLGGTSCGAGCGAVQIGNPGAPILSSSIVVPQRNTASQCLPGLDAGCTIPPSGTGPSDSTLYSPCTIIIIPPGGGTPFAQPRACGRQSWRQVR